MGTSKQKVGWPDLLVVELKGRQVLPRLRELTLLHAFADKPKKNG
jgi:hypothetical protein